MRVKNHMAMWILWFLWFLRVEYSGNQLYKPLCAFLVFVDLVWFLCGSFCGFWIDCGFWLWSARPIVLMWFLWLGGLAIDADDCASTCSLWIGGHAIDAEADGCASYCSLWVGGLALDARCRRLRVLLLFVGRRSCPRRRSRRLRVILLFVDC